MPIYEYECKKCSHVFEVRQSFSDGPVTRCQADGCRGTVKKLFSPPAVIFKGSGFHVNDYGRGSGENTGKSAREDGEKKAEGSGSEACKSCEVAGGCPASKN